MQGAGRGCLGVRSKYVDVFKSGGSGSSGQAGSQAPPPAPPPMMGMGLAPGASTQPFTGTLFMPQPLPGESCT